MFRMFSKGSTPRRAAVVDTADALDLTCAHLAACNSVDAVIAELRGSGRAIVGCDGVTIIRREGEEVVYVTEDAISPLWSGQRFPLRICISGMAILARTPIVIPDILLDKRVPLNAYVATFVRSMAMVPIGHHDPRLAMGAYWRSAEPIPPLAVERLIALAHAAAGALERIERGAPPCRQVA